ncbi:MAG TPA: flagellar hook-basal body complex protein FliE [Candidatus Acidoferrales bacterium]|nr:flagellar hook-basal body complex protein FliE [Candidatus Acidoferrales bacterium]
MNVDPYASAIATIVPGTFVPDVAPKPPASEPIEPESSATVSFRDTVKSMLDDVNDKMVSAGQSAQDLATGKSNDFDGAIKSMEEASLAFQFTMAVRNKLLSAYTEIQQTQF